MADNFSDLSIEELDEEILQGNLGVKVEEQEESDEFQEEELEGTNIENNNPSKETEETEDNLNTEEQSNEGFDNISFQPFIEDLFNSEIIKYIPEDEEIEDNEQGFKRIIEYNIEKGIDNVLESLSDKAKKLIEIELNGGNIEDLLNNQNITVNWNEIDTADNDTNLAALEAYGEAKGLTEKTLGKLAERLLETGELEDYIKEEVQPFLIEQQENFIKKEQESLIQKKEQDKIEYKNYLKESKSIINEIEEVDGFTLSKKEKQELYDYLHEPFFKLKDGRVLTKYEFDIQDKEEAYKMAFRQLYKDKLKANIEAKTEKKVVSSVQRELAKRSAKNFSIKENVNLPKTVNDEDTKYETF